MIGPEDNLAPAGARKADCSGGSIFSIGFTYHRTIISKVKDRDERIFK